MLLDDSMNPSHGSAKVAPSDFRQGFEQLSGALAAMLFYDLTDFLVHFLLGFSHVAISPLERLPV